MKTTIDMAREAGIDEPESDWMYWKAMERFADIVRADEREIVMNEPLTKTQWQRFEDEIRADEREACAKVCDVEAMKYREVDAFECAAAIRNRGNT
jgi:hypothetical protein